MNNLNHSSWFPGNIPDVRPLDRFRSIKIKLGVLVVSTVTLASFLTWLGLRHGLGPTRTFPLVIAISVLLTLGLAHGMIAPLREMTKAARAMSEGDYSLRVRDTSHDEVGQLAVAFNFMAAELANAEKIRREMIANVSHELRTPISALQAQLENLVDGVVEPTPATLNTALKQTERLTRLVKYLLDTSRIEAGAADLNLEYLRLHEYFQDILDSVSMLEADKNLKFIIDVRPVDLVVEADADRIRQVVGAKRYSALTCGRSN